MGVRVRFLLGPAGSGKTSRCLAEIRAALKADPAGRPMILLTPKQATYQWERQLLADPELAGFTRLHIMSFERLVPWVLGQMNEPSLEVLSADGRVMVLRAMVAQKGAGLKRFAASARAPGFAQHLSELITELQRQRCSVARLRQVAAELTESPRLQAKLEDLALIWEAYREWTAQHRLLDAGQQAERAIELLLPPRNGVPPVGCWSGLWVDGFAELTPHEMDLLAGVAAHCEQTTVAFCLEREPEESDCSWRSTWSAMSQTFRKCHRRLAALPESDIRIEIISRRDSSGRYALAPPLAYLEKHWASPPQRGSGGLSGEFTSMGKANAEGLSSPAPAGGLPLENYLRVAECPNPETEARLAAREILRHVRAGGRYGDCAVILRQFEGYDDVLRRIFFSYEIPFFMDRRESISHHPLAELTRYALRTLAFGWDHSDWFGLLKTGLMPASDEEIDPLENAALARGWQGADWRRQPAGAPASGWSDQEESLRQRVVAPLIKLAAWLLEEHGQKTSGKQLAEGLREFWRGLEVEQALELWQPPFEGRRDPMGNYFPHASVWEQMNAWLDNVELAFREEAMALREWLPILEAGWAGLTVGSIPPALDQVLVGTIDRSRHPDLRLVLVLGLNESVFPSLSKVRGLLSETEQAWLEAKQLVLRPNQRAHISNEWFLGYIAFTRARQRLIITFSRTSPSGQGLNPSPFIDRFKRLYPALDIEAFAVVGDWRQSEHRSELAAAILRLQAEDAGAEILKHFQTDGGLARILAKGEQVRAALAGERLAPQTAEALYGGRLNTAVSRLEAFAACPFKFFVHSGLRAQERELFEIDPRGQGSFQHAILQEFHGELAAEGKRWRDLEAPEARERIGRIGEALLARYGLGLFSANETNRFNGRVLIQNLQRLAAVLVGWMRQYEFDPRAAELSFGLSGSALPGWICGVDGRHDLNLRGVVDRLDLYPLDPAGETALAVVMDYKLSGRKMEPVKLHHGLELQLLAYLGAVCELPEAARLFGYKRLLPAGVFYVNLRGDFASGEVRDEVMVSAEQARRKAYRHRGRFDAAWLPHFDNRGVNRGDQFHYRLNAERQPVARQSDAVSSGEFGSLLAQVREHLVKLGRRIYQGEALVAPYRLGQGDTACDYCLYRSVCRFDPWAQTYRVLRPPSSIVEGDTGRKKTKK